MISQSYLNVNASFAVACKAVPGLFIYMQPNAMNFRNGFQEVWLPYLLFFHSKLMSRLQGLQCEYTKLKVEALMSYYLW